MLERRIVIDWLNWSWTLDIVTDDDIDFDGLDRTLSGEVETATDGKTEIDCDTLVRTMESDNSLDGDCVGWTGVVGTGDAVTRKSTDVSRLSDDLKRMLVVLSSNDELKYTTELDKSIVSIPVTDDCDRQLEAGKTESVDCCIPMEWDGLGSR